MQFLKILFWCLLAFVAALFTYGNWTTIEVHLWSGLIADVNLPLLLFVTFLIGFVPTWLYHQAVRWRLRQRLATAERQLTDARVMLPTPAPIPGPVSGAIPGPVPSPVTAAPVDAPPEGKLI